MVKKYSREPPLSKKSVKSSGKDIRVHFKNTWCVARAIRGMSLPFAQKYLKDVLAHKRCIPFTRYSGHVGRTAQAKEFGLTQGRWPEKSVKIVLGLLQNLESNASVKSLDISKLLLSHVQVNKAQKGRRRTYRAHGRINPYMNNPCHLEMFAVEKEEDVKKEKEDKTKKVAKISKKQIARQKLKVGEA